MDTLIKDGLDMQTYMSTLSDELKEMKVTIEEQRHEVAALMRAIKQAHECNQDLTDKNSYLKEKNLKLETYLRKQNLVVEGDEETNSEEVLEKVIKQHEVRYGFEVQYSAILASVSLLWPLLPGGPRQQY